MADYDGSGASEPVPGAERRLADLTMAEALEPPPSPIRPDWMITRWPVSREEFERLNEQAREAEPTPESPEAAGVQEDPIADEAELLQEVPEDAPAGPGPAAPATTASFEGIPQTAFRPPDCTTAAGPNDVMVAVNTDLAGYTKAGVQRFRWPNTTTLFGPVLPSGSSIFDPRVAYDHYARRWIVVAGARRAAPAGSWIMVAVSQGTDPAGAYWVWALDAALDGSAASNNWADYPMLGFDQQGIYITTNQFVFNGGFSYAKLRILNKAELYAGGAGATHAIRWWDFWGLRNPDNSLAFTVQPAVHFRGSTGTPPVYLANSLFPRGSALTLWTLTNALAGWSGGAPALTRVGVPCRAYDLPPDGIQPGTTVPIETNDTRLLNAVYQFAGNVQRLWTTHTSRFTWPGEPQARSVAQWYEIDVPSRSVSQQGAFGSAGNYYFFPAIQTDLGRNAHVVFGRCSQSTFAELRQTGRRTADAPNSLQGSALVRGGTAAYTGARWGDYFGICRDGGDANTVWMYGQYAANGNTWATRVASTRF